MKKSLILSIVILTLFSCSSNDQQEEIQKDAIIGTWYLFSRDNQELDSCEQKSTFIFKENGDFLTASFVSLNNNCINEGESSSKWISKGNDTYNINGRNLKIIFSDNYKTLKIENDQNLWKKR